MNGDDMLLPATFYNLGENAYFRLAVRAIIHAHEGGDAELRRIVQQWLVDELPAAHAADALDALGINKEYARLLRDADARVTRAEAAAAEATATEG